MKIVTTLLLMFENINFSYSLECNCKHKSKGWDCLSHVSKEWVVYFKLVKNMFMVRLALFFTI